VSNVKQITLGLLQCAQDYDEKFGLAGGYNGDNTWARQWPIAVQPYIKNWQVMVCPSNDRGNPNYLYWGQTLGLLPSYGALNGLQFTSMGSVDQPSSKILIMESNHHAVANWNEAQYAKRCGAACSTTPPPSGNDAPHNDGVNVGFVDGHVKWGKITMTATPPQGWLP